MSLQPLITIVGPTAVGKTDISIEVAKQIKGEIISADSMLVYRGMDIGTAKPTLEEMQGIPHYLIDVVEPNQDYSVALYQQQAEACISAIAIKGNMPMLVGGTGLYVRSVIDPYDFTPAPSNEIIRQRLKDEAEQLGPEKMHSKLAEVDPQSAARLHPNDLRRVIRALEVFYQTGKPISQYQVVKNAVQPKYKLIMFGLNMDRQLLYQRIEQRVDIMIEMGLVREVEGLLNKYGALTTAFQGLGYKEICGYLAGEYSLADAVETLKRNTRRFAKRQLTWFRADKRIQWIDLNKDYDKLAVASEITSRIAGEFSTV